MSKDRILNILKKEWELLRHDLNSILLVTLLPLLITGQGIMYIVIAARFGVETLLDNALFLTALENLRQVMPQVAGLSEVEQVGVLAINQFSFYLLLIPTMIAMSFAAYSIVEEKTSRTLEPLLATPVRTWEILFGKAIAAVIPAVIMTWVCSVVFIAGIYALGWGYLLPFVLNASWFVSLLLLAPAITVMSFLLCAIVSSRAKDAKSAQTISLVIILPVFGLIGLQLTGVLWFTPLLGLALTVAVAIADYFVLKVAVRLFQRENIIIKWR